MKPKSYPPAFGSSGTDGPARSRGALRGTKEGMKRKKEGGKEGRKGEIKQRFRLTERRAPSWPDPGGQADLGNTLGGLLLDLSLTPIKGPALESRSTDAPEPRVYVYFGGSAAPASHQCSPHTAHATVKAGRGRAIARGETQHRGRGNV